MGHWFTAPRMLGATFLAPMAVGAPLHGPEDAPNYSGQSYAHYQPYSQPTDQYHVEFHPHNQYSESPIPYQHPQYTPHPQYHPHLHPHREAYPQTHPPPDPADPYADPTAPRGLRNVYTRPYMGSFQEYLFHPSTRAWLDTMVWSSAQPHSVNDMVDKAFGSRKGELIAVWARDTLGLEEKDYYRKTQTTKDLARPWAKLSISPSSTSTRTTDPDTPLGHSAHTTLLLDDSPLKAHLQPWNHLCIREYSGSLRQADIQCRTREERKKQASATTAQQDKNTDALVPAVDHTDPTQNQTPADIPSSPEHPKKRKRPKKNKPAVPAIELEDVLRLGLGGYDPTLLAVVGVLDVVKWEGNVAGWMRAGGLSATASTLSEDEEEGKAEGEGRDEVVGSGGGKTRRGLVEVESVSVESIASGDEKRRRVSGERDAEGSAGEAAVGVSSPATSPPTSASASPPTTSISTPTVSPTMSTAPALAAKIAPSTPDTNIGDTGQWFEDHTALRYWVRRGVRALEGMGIQIVSGVVGQA
ncbi:hypothetical protein H0H87_010552 [Tephrocybe sp. NHM501043]|nr:hypothetical protein H0H87_010552 [Tephrocybe sp. NHM501043]